MGAKSENKSEPAYGAHLTTLQFSLVVTALALGTILEWYDFFVFSMLNSTIVQVFFPAQDPAVQQISFWGVFFVGFVARPIGSILFGHIGDTRGRRLVLLITICMMAVPTVLIGALPTYQQAGVAAPALLAVLRLIQGLAMGGEFGSALVYLHEIADKPRQGFIGSVGFASAISGCVLGVLVAMILELTLTPSQMVVFGWRIPFLLSLVSASAALALRLHMPEPHEFLEGKEAVEHHQLDHIASYGRRSSTGGASLALSPSVSGMALSASGSTDAEHGAARGSFAGQQKLPQTFSGVSEAHADQNQHLQQPAAAAAAATGAAPFDVEKQHVNMKQAASSLPVVMLFRWHWAGVLLQFLFEAWVSISFWTLTTWLPGYFHTALHIPTIITQAMLMVNLTICVMMQLVAGRASDMGLPRLWSAISVFVISGAIVMPVLRYGMQPGALAACWLLHALLLALVGWVLGLIPATCSVIYPAAVRTTGFNLAHNMAMSWLGGLSPTIVTALTGALGNKALAPGLLLVAAAGVSLLAGLVLVWYTPAANKTPADAEVEVEGS